MVGMVSIITIVGPMFLFALGNGIVMPTAMSLAIMPFPKMAGSAAAWVGCCQAALGALCVTLSVYCITQVLFL
ncbi:MAG: DHA1 family bicyclomycin/chloramphenicol resistance-like MFS transporter [Oleiphilaceae bacterium]